VGIVAWAAATLAFATLHLAPGDAATAMGDDVPAQVRAQVRAKFSLDQPLPVQYARWLGAAVTGDFGWSPLRSRPVSDEVRTALGNTLRLVLPAFALAMLGGVFVGRWQAVHAEHRRDRATSTLLLVLYSVPEFWLGLTLVLLFARQWPLFPTGGMESDVAAYMTSLSRAKDRLWHLVLPVVTLTLVGVATVARYQRASLVQVLAQPFVRAAAAAGLPQHRILHGAWRASLPPVVTLGGVLLPAYAAGVVFVEGVFSWPGMGRLLVEAVARRDLWLVSGIVVVGATITALAAAAADLLRGVVDPRLTEVDADRRDAPTGPGVPA